MTFTVASVLALLVIGTLLYLGLQIKKRDQKTKEKTKAMNGSKHKQFQVNVKLEMQENDTVKTNNF